MAFAPQLYAVVARTSAAPQPKRNLVEIKTAKLAELKTKKAIDRANALLDRIAERQAALARRIEALERQQRVCGVRAERIGARIVAELEAAALTRADGFRSSVLISASPPAVEILDAELVPAEFLRHPKPPKPAPDKPKIKAAIEAGQRVAGCKLVQGVTLRRS